MADETLLNVVVGGSVSGNIDFTGDTDDIRVFLVSGQTYLVSLRGTGGTAIRDSFLEVYDPSAALVNFDDDGGNGVYSFMTFTAAATDNYTIRASSFSHPGDPGTGQWTVDVRVQGVDAVGDATFTAVAMSLGTTFGFRETATVSGGADLDRYEVTLEEGHFYTFNLAAGADYATNYTAVPAGEIDTILRLRNPAGTLLAQNDDLNFPTDISSGFGFFAQTSGTYYLDVTGYAGQTGGYVVDMQDIDYHNRNPLEAINWDSADSIDTVAHTPTAYVYFGAAGETFGEPGLTTFGWNATEKAAVMSALLEFTKITGITYLETTDINQAEFRLNTVSTGNTYFRPQDPALGSQQGIGIFNVNEGGWDKPGVSTQDIPGDQVSLNQGGFAYATILRAFGQAHGLASPHNNEGGSEIMLGVVAEQNSYGLFNLNQGVYTIMSKNDAWDFHPDGPSPFTIASIGSGWSGTLGAFDIAVLQQRYGVHAYAAGDTVYSLSAVQQSGVYYQTIWDTGGTDAIIYDGTGRATIDLTAATLDYSPTGGGVLSFVDQIPGTAGQDGIWGGFTIANGVVIENATGGSGNDVLTGNSADNRIDGRGGNDTLTGRGGNDTFVFATGYGADTATDFVEGAGTEDRVDLTAFSNILTFDDVLSRATQQGANTVIDFGNGDTLTLNDVVREDLRPDDFRLITVKLGDGPDSITAPAGASFDGGQGIDTVTFNFKLTEAKVTYTGNQVVINGPSGSRTELVSFETFVFTDGTIETNDGDWLVDDLFYYSHHHDVWNAHTDADFHYNAVGWMEGRDPNAFFDTSIYLSANPDVAVSGENPLNHFDTIGWKEGRIPSLTFDGRAYLAANPDVAAAHIDPLWHFLAVGAGEGRQPIAPDRLIGASGFDYAYYLNTYTDVKAAGVDPLQHFQTTGWQEGRNPNALFDTAGYLATYTDVAAAQINPLDHYNVAGWHEGRDPSVNFDTTSYLAAYADVAAANVNPLLHFLHVGQDEGRSALADGVWG